MDSGEPIIDFQSGAMSDVNRAIDHCTIYVLETATFTTLTFRNNYDPTRVPKGRQGDASSAIGNVAPDTVDNTTDFPVTAIIEGVKSYRLATGVIYVKHYKN